MASAAGAPQEQQQQQRSPTGAVIGSLFALPVDWVALASVAAGSGGPGEGAEDEQAQTEALL